MQRRHVAPLRLACKLLFLIFSCHLFKSAIIVREMNRCANEDFPLEDLVNSKTLWEKVNSLRQPFGIVMLNKHVVDMTLNWLCNTATMEGVHERILFFTLDQEAADALLKFYPTLRIFTLKAKCLQVIFKVKKLYKKF